LLRLLRLRRLLLQLQPALLLLPLVTAGAA
jgi:hypothetical protein